MERGKPSILHTARACSLLRTYIQREPGVLYLQAALIFFFFLYLSWLRRGVERWTEEEPSPIKVGDVIQIDTDIGEVRRVGIRACIIRTTDGSEIIVPNGSIIANKVTNWPLSDRYRAIEVPVTVARGAPPTTGDRRVGAGRWESSGNYDRTDAPSLRC